MAKRNIFEIIFLTAKDFSPPLYYFILHFWIKIFGGSEIALRSLSIIFFWATIYVAFLFLNNIFKIKQKKSFFYLIFFILNPLLLYFAFEARMYSMLAFFASLSYYAFYKKNYRLYLLATISGLFTHYFMIIVVSSQLLFLLINKKKDFNFKKSIIYLSLLIFSPLVIFFLSQSSFLNSFWLLKPRLYHLMNLPGIIYTGHELNLYPNSFTVNAMEKNVFYFSLLLILIIIIGFFHYRKKARSKEHILFNFLFIWAIGIPLFALIFSFIKSIYLPRYFIFTTVGFLLLTIFILEKISVLLRVFLIAILFVLTINYNQLQLTYRTKGNFRKTLMEIKALSKENDLVYVTSDLDFFTAQYYLDENKVYIYGKSYKEIPVYNGKVLIPKEKMALTLPFYPQKAFILNSDGSYTIQAMY
jgi:uncharacterized membrane protein